MLIFSIVIILLAPCQLDAQSYEEINAATLRVREYLLRSTKQVTLDETSWLQNSGKIGVGYDLLTGSPICYTGECQMEGFRQPVFKLNMTKQAEGSCTNKFIPQNVNLDCLPSMQITANTESISTLDQLMESTKKGIGSSASVSVYDNSFSYSHSQETRSMIDTIVQRNSTVYFTRASISWVRLSAFTPLLALSDQFRYVIHNMPCCNESKELDQYIRKFIIDYFGLMYVNDLLLGGIAQQKIIISEENRKNLQQKGFTTTDQTELKTAASAIFSISAKLTLTEQFDQTKLNVFNRFSQQSSLITLGGATFMQPIGEWSKTVSSNPTIIKFGVAPLLDLLTAKRFPGDANIESKSRLIQRGQEKYLTNPLFCYNNCSRHGSCIPSGYFRFGQCRCNSGWTGIDCSVKVQAPTGRLIPLYRYSKGAYDHFYTTNPDEIGTTTPGSIGRYGYYFEGNVGQIYASTDPQPSFTLPLYRYFNTRNGQHFYTSSWQEIGTNANGVVIGNWKCEGIVGYICSTNRSDTQPLHRYYSSNHDAHFYTISTDEIGTITPGAVGKFGYKYEGIAGYVVMVGSG